MKMKAYHVTGTKWNGNDITSRDIRMDSGIDVEWKWVDMDESTYTDSYQVCFFTGDNALDDAEVFKSEFAPEGDIIEINIPSPKSPKWMEYEEKVNHEYGYDYPKSRKVEKNKEKYNFVASIIPLEWIVGVIG